MPASSASTRAKSPESETAAWMSRCPSTQASFAIMNERSQTGRRMSTREATAAVRKVYADLDERPIHRDCHLRTECCRFRLTGRTPLLTAGEALVLAAGWRATGRKGAPPDPPDGSCLLLDTGGRCKAYEARPFGCRTHFCQPAGGPFPRCDVIDLIRRLEDIDRNIGGDGPRRIGPALRSALAAHR